MLTSSTMYKAVLRTPHRRVAYIDVFDIDGNVRALGVPIVAGQVSANLTNRVTRSATFDLPPSFWPRDPSDIMSPLAAVVRIYAGLGYGDGTEEVFPVFTGRVQDAQRADSGQVSFRADDLASDVIGFRFEAPTTSTPDSLIQDEIQRLILGALPQATFSTFGVPNAPTPTLAWDEDRGQALDDLSEALGGRWYALGDGSFTVQPFNYALGTIVDTYTDGPGGLLSSAQISITRDGMANSVVVVSERVDGTDPVRAISRDTDPGSPTLFGGLFGRVTQIIKIQTPLSATEASNLAQTQRAAATALNEQWSVGLVPDYTIEPGDTVRLEHRGVQADQLVDTITYPLMTTQLMTLGTRSAVPTPTN